MFQYDISKILLQIIAYRVSASLNSSANELILFSKLSSASAFLIVTASVSLTFDSCSRTWVSISRALDSNSSARSTMRSKSPSTTFNFRPASSNFWLATLATSLASTSSVSMFSSPSSAAKDRASPFLRASSFSWPADSMDLHFSMFSWSRS